VDVLWGAAKSPRRNILEQKLDDDHVDLAKCAYSD